jgi:subtilisin family serine protease
MEPTGLIFQLSPEAAQKLQELSGGMFEDINDLLKHMHDEGEHDAGEFTSAVSRLAEAETGKCKIEKVYSFKDDPVDPVDGFDGLYDLEKADLLSEEDLLQEEDDCAAILKEKMTRTFKIDAGDKETADYLHKLLQEIPGVERVQYDILYKSFSLTAQVTNFQPNFLGADAGDDPNDTLYGRLWGIQQIKCKDAWKDSEGEGVTVAVIDTGVRAEHPDLEGNIVPGVNFIDSTQPPSDTNGHGTMCAGIIAAVRNNEKFVVGVAPKAKIMAIKIFRGAGDLGASGAKASICADAIIYAADHGARVISNSWGPANIDFPDEEVKTAVKYAHCKNCVVVFAAGNEGADIADRLYLNHDKVISVAASDKSSHRWEGENDSSSNYGAGITVSAPGLEIISTSIDSGDYSIGAGTSMACPHVAGVAALILSVRKDISPDDVKDIIRNGVDNFKYVTGQPIGLGTIDAAICVSKALIHNLGPFAKIGTLVLKAIKDLWSGLK